jgi:hypothetical protein
MLEALLDEPWNSGERQPIPSVSETKSHVVAYLIRILSDDLKCWISTVKKQPADLLRERKDVPLVARLLWPHNGSTIGHFNNNCRDLIKLHLQAVVSLLTLKFHQRIHLNFLTRRTKRAATRCRIRRSFLG